MELFTTEKVPTNSFIDTNTLQNELVYLVYEEETQVGYDDGQRSALRAEPIRKSAIGGLLQNDRLKRIGDFVPRDHEALKPLELHFSYASEALQPLGYQ